METTDTLILTPFQRAIESLERALELPEDEIVRDATIKRFDYTYELAWKMIRRHLAWSGASEVEPLSRRELFHQAAKVGLIADGENWFAYNEARNQTSQSYKKGKAKELYAVAREFAPDARKLLIELKKHHR